MRVRRALCRSMFWLGTCASTLSGCSSEGGDGGEAVPASLFNYEAFPGYDAEALAAAVRGVPANSHTAFYTADDLDGDGLLDLLSVTYTESSSSSESLYLRFGEADRIFGDPTLLVTGLQPTRAVVADFDGDGIRDIAVARYDGVGLMLGGGDRTFAPEVSISAPEPDVFLFPLHAADLDGDGDVDLVVTRDGFGLEDFVTVFLNDGAARFTPVETTITDGPAWVLTPPRDVNEDGLPDLFCSFGSQGDSGEYGLMLNAGGGAFAAPDFSFAAAGSLSQYHPGQADMGDVNGDGMIDIVVASPSSSDVIGAHYSYLGDGMGTFTEVPAGPKHRFGPMYLSRILDVYGDANPDLLVSNPPTGGIATATNPGLVIHEGLGDGTFGAESYTLFPDGADFDVLQGDFNRDGLLDLFVGSVIFGGAQGSLQLDTLFETGIAYPAWDVAAVELDGDGHPDLVTGGLGAVSTFLALGDGEFIHFSDSGPNARGGAPGGQRREFGDYNGDGLVDLLYWNFPPIGGLATNLGDGTLALDVLSFGATTLGIANPGDLDGDGLDDLIGLDPILTNQVRAHFSLGNRTFGSTLISNTSTLAMPRAADIDGDGLLTVFIHDNLNDVLISFETQADRTFVPGPSIAMARAAGVHRIDEDGLDDLVVQSTLDGALTVYFGRADGLLDEGPTLVLPMGAEVHGGRLEFAALGDDDTPFILVEEPFLLSVFRRIGPRDFEALPPVPHLGELAGDWMVVDFTGDGVRDLGYVMASGIGRVRLEILAGRGDGTFDFPMYFDKARGRSVVEDLNGDGKPDIATLAGGDLFFKFNRGGAP